MYNILFYSASEKAEALELERAEEEAESKGIQHNKKVDDRHPGPIESSMVAEQMEEAIEEMGG